MVFGLVMALFAAAGLIADGWNGSAAARAKIKPDVSGVRAQFAMETAQDWSLRPCVGKSCPR